MQAIGSKYLVHLPTVLLPETSDINEARSKLPHSGSYALRSSEKLLFDDIFYEIAVECHRIKESIR